MRQYPIFITCRDRLSCLLELLHWLERAGHTCIYLIDNESTYPPLLAFFDTTPYPVIKLDSNLGGRAPWTSGVVDDIAAGNFYVVTDPDVVPVAECPLDAVAHFRALLDRYPNRIKAGFGLKIDDLPTYYRHAAEVRAWESRFWTNEVEPGVYAASIDTTFALYRPGVPFELDPSLRTGAPYLARHMGWYVRSRRLGAEERYYQEHAASDTRMWSRQRLSPYFYELSRSDSEELQHMSVTDRVDRLDLSLFDSIHETSTTFGDRRSLLALQSSLGMRSPFDYMEIGPASGETMQTFVADPRCRRITAIEYRDLMSTSERDVPVDHAQATTKHKLNRLAAVPDAEIGKVTAIVGDIEDLDPADFRADLCFIDGLVTGGGTLGVARFCRQIIRDRGVIVFHNRTAVAHDILRFLRELTRPHEIYPMRYDLLVVEIGSLLLRPEPTVRSQIRPAWFLASRLRLIPLLLRLRETARR